MVNPKTSDVTSNTFDRFDLSPVHHATDVPFKSTQISGFTFELPCCIEAKVF